MQNSFDVEPFDERKFMTCAEFASLLSEVIATHNLYNKPITFKIGTYKEMCLRRHSSNLSESVADDRLTIQLDID